jgi:hypothetical protein
MAMAAGLVAELADVDLQHLDIGGAERLETTVGEGQLKGALAGAREEMALVSGVSEVTALAEEG